VGAFWLAIVIKFAFGCFVISYYNE